MRDKWIAHSEGQIDLDDVTPATAHEIAYALRVLTRRPKRGITKAELFAAVQAAERGVERRTIVDKQLAKRQLRPRTA